VGATAPPARESQLADDDAKPTRKTNNNITQSRNSLSMIGYSQTDTQKEKFSAAFNAPL
jgi:hypothetical protein